MTMKTNISIKSKLAEKEKRSVKGVRGFVRVSKPRNKIVNIRLQKQHKLFFEQYAAKHNITVTDLVLNAIEWYTGFDGTNGHELIEKTFDDEM
jgi:hypothetical protein